MSQFTDHYHDHGHHDHNHHYDHHCDKCQHNHHKMSIHFNTTNMQVLQGFQWNKKSSQKECKKEDLLFMTVDLPNCAQEVGANHPVALTPAPAPHA